MDRLSELLLQIRHYGRLRFAIFTVFLAVIAGLLAAFYRGEALVGRFVLMLLGILFCLCFAYLQLKLGAIHAKCQDELEKLAEQNATGGRDFIKLLLGETNNDPLANWLDRFKGRMQEKFPGLRSRYQAQLRFLGPVNLLMLFFHLLIAGLWFLLFLVEFSSWLGRCG